MAERKGKTIILQSKPRFIGNAAVVGKKEGEGPLGKEFDEVFTDTTMGEDSWEKSESLLLKKAVEKVLQKSAADKSEVDMICSGDLLNQCIGSSFGIRDFNIPFCGVYGACSTMALSLCIASLMIESGGFERCIAATSSHFCSAEKQFRKPLEYGGQRPPSAQWTVTGAGAALIGKNQSTVSPYIDKIHMGTIQDFGITDSNNMGAAMAPAAKKTISDFLRDTGTKPSDYDMILTGDLGSVGSELLHQLFLREDGLDISAVHKDCGLMIYDRESQDVHAGGSGCGCSGTVLCSYILNSMRAGKFSNILFIATGALMSTVSSLQGESIPGIAHLLNIRKGE
ncbi:MAG: stage V sporulation protein AD [Oscillospiraceae bacterium]|nr:stage V sporulation protein AD [Oscillospiraceae bacterium]